MKKQSGFTLIELMVVMAIIAILATAGLAAYTGYIKKARDTTRIADVSAINTIVLGMMSSTGLPPDATLKVYNAVAAANNDTILMDPQSSANGVTTKSTCLDDNGTTLAQCSFTYRLCDSGLGYAIGTRFESRANVGLYTDDAVNATGGTNFIDASLFEVGNCKAYTNDTPQIISCTTGSGSSCTVGGTTTLTANA